MDELDIEQASARCGRSIKTLRRWIHSGKLDCHLVGGRYFFDVADIDKMRDKMAGNQTLLERIESLESLVGSLSDRISALESRIHPSQCQ